MPKTSFSKLGPFEGKIIDAKPVDSNYIDLVIEGPEGKKYKKRTGKSSELLRRALQQNDPWVSFTLDERGELTIVTKRQYRASAIK